MTMMRRFTLLLGVVVCATASEARAQAACAPTGTLADLVGLGSTGCTVADKLFSDFTTHFVSTGFSTGMTAADVHYDLLNPTPFSHGFLFTSTWAAPGGGILDQSLLYHVSTITGAPSITDIHLSQAGEFVNGVGSNGFVRIDEDVCVGDEFLTGCAGGFVRSLSTNFSLNPALNGPNAHFAHSSWTPGVSMIDVVKDIRVDGGTAGAGFSIMDQYVTQTPEPASYALIATGIGMLGVVGRRRRRRV